ncbi:MAG TPA: DNA methyltransferase [Candidatus Paceibacterota bacterium]|nr:DNA methyltransferase [Candidatus Paceibacterota bacterium]HPT40006.1 DNA methyltransferase [Candidatus Paceibacterota bacterium]
MMQKKAAELKLHPDEFEIECTTVWAFPRRGNWATHTSNWRGNWSPEVARNLILRYSNEGDVLLDSMIGGGTTAIEAKILNRNIIYSDVNQQALDCTKRALAFEVGNKAWQRGFKWDSRHLEKLKDDSIDFILTHPPYVDIIKYSDGKLVDDLSNIHDIEAFCDEMEKVAKEFYRILKPGKYCAILMGDTRRNKMYQPLAYRVMDRFLKAGLLLKEDIIKRQFNCRATGFWVKRSQESNFLLIMHEHLFVFQKLK